MDREEQMNKEEQFSREDWLKSLKAGAKVVNLRRGKGHPLFYSYYELLEIEKITRKGDIRLTNGVILNNLGNGSYNDSEGRYHFVRIEPITQEVLDHGRKSLESLLKRERIIELFDNFMSTEYSLEDLAMIEEILLKPYK